MWYNGAGGDFLTHLLVVDDEVSILELIKNSLGKDGYLITVCQNADDVDIKKLHFYDLILLDVMMPGTDGFEFCKQIRNMVDCPILFLTAKTLEEDILFGLGIGADDYITKPFRIQELRARVAAHLRREKREHHSTLSSPANSIWKDAPAFFEYITRCQSFLQMGKPDNDFLLYLPLYDIWQEQPDRFLLFTIHHMAKRAPKFIETVHTITKNGYDVDYISDAFVQSTRCRDGKLITEGGASYKALIIPPSMMTTRRGFILATACAMV